MLLLVYLVIGIFKKMMYISNENCMYHVLLYQVLKHNNKRVE